MGDRLSVLAGLALVLPLGPSTAANPPPRGGTVFVTAANARRDDDTSTQLSANAAMRALGAKGFIFLNEPDHAAYIAEVVVDRTDIGTAQEKVPADRASAMGAGVSIPFATGQSRLVPLERTELAISIRKRGEPNALWHGAAVTVRSAGARDAAADTVATVLSAAALQIYPREPGETVGVP